MIEFYLKTTSDVPQHSYNLGAQKNLSEFFEIAKDRYAFIMCLVFTWRYWFLPFRRTFSRLDGIFWYPGTNALCK